MASMMQDLHGSKVIDSGASKGIMSSDGSMSDVSDGNYGELPLQTAVDSVKTRNFQVKADAYTFAAKAAMAACKPSTDKNPLASSTVTNRHFVPVRPVTTEPNGSTTAVAQIDPETYVWLKTKPTADIGVDDVVPTSTIRDDVVAQPPSAKQIHVTPTTDMAEIIRQDLPYYKSERVELKATDERVQRADAYESSRVNLCSRDDAGRLKSEAIVGFKRKDSSIERLEVRRSGTIVTDTAWLKQNRIEWMQDGRKNLRANRAMAGGHVMA